MEPIFDRTSRTVGWLNNGVICDANQQCLAFVTRGVVMSYEARYLGTFDRGFIRDPHGQAVAFLLGAIGAPTPPLPRRLPVAPVAPAPPVTPVTPVPASLPLPSPRWSPLSWDEFLG